MKNVNYCLKSIIILTLIILFYGRPAGAVNRQPQVWLNGRITELTLKTVNDRYYALFNELPGLANSNLPTETIRESEQKTQLWVPLRECWEASGRSVFWLPELNILVLQHNKNVSMDISDKAKEVIEKALADTDWLKVKSKEKLKTHLELYYTPEMVGSLLEPVYEFIQIPTDWHSTYELGGIQVLDRTEDWILCKIFVKERLISRQNSIANGLIKIVKTGQGLWKIAYFSYE